jgi:polysaccharide biosynthesis protein PslA
MNLIRRGTIAYLLADYCGALSTWFLFLLYRRTKGELLVLQKAIDLLSTKDFINTLIVMPICWLILHYHAGAYFNIYRKSRLQEIIRTFIASAVGSIIIFLLIVLNDKVNVYGYFSTAFVVYFLLQFIITSVFRAIVLNNAKAHLRARKFKFNTIIIGSNTLALQMLQLVSDSKQYTGNNVIGFVPVNESEIPNHELLQCCTHLGNIQDIEQIVLKHSIDEVLIAIDTEHHHQLQHILTALSYQPVVLKIQPDFYDIISGSVKTSNILGSVLIEIYPELMPDWQRVIKRSLDVIVSIIVLILLSPLYLITAILVKVSSAGKILFTQERIGLYGKPFNIYKYRSMVASAEQDGPALSHDTDPRITPIGKVIRKWRIDELPQFVNVLKGDMSLVGPRPERKHFIDIICQTHSQYKFLHKVKPGLSSWGMVKYGYASTVGQMIERMRYDLLYIKNCSLALDTKIMLHTILVILQGRGK